MCHDCFEELLELAYKAEFFKNNLVKALARLIEVEKENERLKQELEKVKVMGCFKMFLR